MPELRGWAREDGTLRLGAGLTYTEAMEPELARLLPALAEASRTVGSPQIRNRGTIGGNLGTASPAGDAHPPLLVEDAEIEVASARGVRRVPLAEFLKQDAERGTPQEQGHVLLRLLDLALTDRLDSSLRLVAIYRGRASLFQPRRRSPL